MPKRIDLAYSNEHWNLLQHLAQKLKLKNDAAIARALGTSQPIISKVRNSRSVLSSMLLMRILDVLSITTAELRELLGEGAYQNVVWSKESKSLGLSFKLMDADPAWTIQTEVVSALTTMLRQHGYALLKTGQRSGKTVIETRVANRLNAENVYLFSRSPIIAQMFPEYMNVIRNPLPDVKDQFPPNSVVIIDEAFWMPGSFTHFEQARQLDIPVLVVGSNGPEYRDEWATLPHALSYSTWEINPMVTREELQPLYEQDWAKAERDFEAF